MKSIFRGMKGKWDQVDYMQLIPSQRQAADVDEIAGRVVVLMPRYTDPILGRLLQPRLPAHKRYIRVPLDQRGAFLWTQIDGRLTVAALAQAYAERFPEDNKESHTRVSLFLHAMFENKFISYLNGPR